MSVTITVEPAAMHAAFNPVEWTATSDRSGSTQYTPLTPADSGGFAKFTQAGHVYAVNDVLTLTGFSVDAMNTDVLVTAKDATTFTTNLVWSSSPSYAVAGTVTMNNQNLIITVSLFVSSVLKAVKDVKDFSGFNFDISKILQGLVTYDEIDTAGADVQSPASSGSSVTYTLSLQDKWTDKFGNNYSDTPLTKTTIGGATIVAFNMALNDSQVIADYIMATGPVQEFLTVNKTIYIHEDETYQLAFITTEANVKLRTESYATIGGAPLQVDAGAVAINNNRGMILIDVGLFPTTKVQMDVMLLDGASGLISEAITFLRRTKCVDGARLEWKNLLGGFDAYTFVEIEDMQSAKVQNYQNTIWQTAQARNTQRTKLIGEFSPPETLDWLSQIITSRKISKDGSNAVITNESLITDSRDYKKPVLTVQTDDKITN